jgi:hypothetical protein
VEAILRAGLELPGNNTNFAEAAANPPVALAGSTASLPTETREEQSHHVEIPTARAELSEHFSLVSRWFYSNPREGEIFFHDGEWPYRRILRACARLMAEAAAPAGGNLSTSNQTSNRTGQISREKINRLKKFAKAHHPPRK